MQISPFGRRGRGRSMRRRMMRNIAQPMPYQGIKGLGRQRPPGKLQRMGPLGGPQQGWGRPQGSQQVGAFPMQAAAMTPEMRKMIAGEGERLRDHGRAQMIGRGMLSPTPGGPSVTLPQPQWGGEDAPAPQPPQQPLPYQPTQQPMPVGPPAPQVAGGPGGGLQPIQQPTVQDQVASLPAGFARPQSASPSAGGGGGGGGGGAGGGEGPPTRWTMEIKPAATGGIIGLQEGGYVPMVYANGGYIPGYFWGDLVRGAGSVLSRAAPLASMVPGVGTLAAAGMGALGGVLQGGEGGVGGALKRGLTQGLGTYLGSKAQEKGSEDWLARVAPLIAAQEAMEMGHAGGQGGPPSGRVMPGAPAARRQAGPVSTVTDVEAPASQMYNLFEHLPRERKHGGPVGSLYAARRFGGGPIPRYQEGGEMEGEGEEGPPRRQTRGRRGTGRRGGRRARTTPRERRPLIDRVQPLPVRPPPPPPPPIMPAVIPQIEGEAPPVEEVPLPPPVAPPPSPPPVAPPPPPPTVEGQPPPPPVVAAPPPPPPPPPPIAPPMPPPWLMTGEGGEGGPEGPPPSPPAFTPPQAAPPVVAPPLSPPQNPVWTDESIGEEVPNTVAAASSPSNVADPADQQWSFFPPGFGGGEGDDEGPTDETEQQATQQQLGSQTIDVETPTVEPPSGPIDWGQTATTFTLDPGDEGMPPAGENIYGHGRGDIEDAEGSAELPPDVSRTDVIRDSADDKGLKTLKDIEEAEPGVADIITKPEEDAAALNLEDSLVTQPQGIDQGNLASVYAQNRRDLGQEPLPDPDPTAGRTMPAAENPFKIDVTGSTGATQDATQSPSMFDPRGHDPWAMPTTAADFAQAGDQGTADMLTRLSAPAAPVESYVPVDPTLKYHPATMQAGGMVPEAQGDMSADVQEMFAQIPGLQEAVMTAVQQPDSPEAQEIMAGLQEAFGPDILQAIIQTAGAQQAAPAPQEMMQVGGLIPGNGDAMADDIITTADANTPNAQDIAISSGEYVIAGDVVSGLGSGNTMAGAEVLDQFQEDVRAGRNGSPQQPPPIDLSEVLPGTYGERYA